jgi:hypothetical protein
MDMGRIHNHKEVKFMKKFNLAKGLIIGLLTLALCFTCFGVMSARAEETTATKTTAVEATYDAAADTVKAGSNAYVYVLKAASGNKIKAGTSANGQMASNKIAISDLGIKDTKKDVYLYVCDKEVEVEETVSANLTIKGNPNKIVGVVDYTQADILESVSVLSAYYVDKATKKSIDIASASLYWSSDQDKWYQANSSTQSTRKNSKNQAVADGFLGADLAEMLEGGGIIYLKQAGTDGATGTAQFGSKVAKVKIVKQAAAPKVKIDVAKDTIALKNGFDFAIAVKGATEYDQYGTWYTILPVLKTATVTDTIVGGMIESNQTKYKPLEKKNTNAGKVAEIENDSNKYYSYTKTAVKALSIDKLFETVDLNSETDGIQLPADYRIAVRKSATEKKPASAVALIELSLKTEKPLVNTLDNVKGQFLVATADEFTKKGLSLGDIAGFPGYTGTNDLAIETEGFDKTFKVKTATTNTKGRDDGSSFEYTIVATADYAATGDAAIDWTTVKWKKLDPAKLKITEKLSAKYSTIKGTKKTATLKATASADLAATADNKEEDDYGRTVIKESAIKEGTKALLLIRRAGDKSSGLRGSEFIALYVAKENGKYNLYSTVSNGELAYKYTVSFFKYSPAITEGEERAAGWYQDDSIAEITGWSRKAKTGVALPALTGAEYWKIDTVAETAPHAGNPDFGDEGQYKAASDKIAAADGTDEVAKGAYQIEVNASGDSHVAIAIREYANITVNADFVTVAGSGNNATYTPIPTNATYKLAEIKAGKACTVNGTTWTAEGDIVKYVGDEASITVREIVIPTGYHTEIINGVTSEVVAGEGYAFTTGAYSANTHKVTVIAGTAEPIVVSVRTTVYREYTVTFDTGTLGLDIPVAKTDKDGKISLSTANGIAANAENNTFVGWYVNQDLSGDPVTADKVYEADTTLYGKFNATSGN